MLTVKQARSSAAGPNQAEMAGLAARSYHDPGHFLSRTRGGSMTNQGTNPGSARSEAPDSRDLGHATTVTGLISCFYYHFPRPGAIIPLIARYGVSWATSPAMSRNLEFIVQFRTWAIMPPGSA